MYNVSYLTAEEFGLSNNNNSINISIRAYDMWISAALGSVEQVYLLRESAKTKRGIGSSPILKFS